MHADPYLDRLIDLALDEDLGAAGDVTSNALVRADAVGRGELWAKEPMVLSGLHAFARVFEKVDARCEVQTLADEAGRAVFVPPVRACTDNAAMIAYAGAMRFSRGELDSGVLSPETRTRIPRVTRKGSGPRQSRFKTV